MRQKLGQHFLKEKETLSFIAKNTKLKEGETLIEIGPGHGELTNFLLPEINKLNGSLFCIEKDQGFFEKIDTLLTSSSTKNRLFRGDVREILPILPDAQKLKNYVIVGNIPYYITSFLFRIISNLSIKPHTTTLLIQKEVALRATQKPPHQNLLSAIISSFADAMIIKQVPRNQFSPPPKVDSAVIQLITHNQYKKEEIERYIVVTKALFKHPRKTILNNLREADIEKTFKKNDIQNILTRLNIPENTRAQVLSSETIMELAKMLYNEK
ncbi:ribosomal RNA small subunit methyltransferase A [Candidatus Parcubacteria bacterium]|jgi:16S rRNA (adenine1518-N6/adenine1519-N6)-dimethyltransferase|nr:MAG: ribosomal RNA small subunit methyltransferase A [Candidatus Parcubacteria bacterium]